MKHSTIDQFAENSSFYRFNPRMKLIAIVSFVIVVALLQNYTTLSIAFLYIVFCLLVTSIPLKHIGRHYLLSLPFIAVPSITLLISMDIFPAFLMFLRISTCVLGIFLLVMTTQFFDLLKSMQKLRFPRLFVNLLMFIYRYSFVFIEELQKVNLSKKARGFSGGKHLFDKRAMHILASTVGIILVKAYERGKSINDALISRGFSGEVKTLNPFPHRPSDYAFCTTIIIMAVFLLLTEWRLV